MEQHADLLGRLANVSIVTLVITVVALPMAVLKLPADYFVREKRELALRGSQHPLVWAVLSFCKNLVGILLILIGVAMLVLPGQGTVAILIGLAISNFPGKFAIEQRIACQPTVGRTPNKIRDMGGAAPLQMPIAPDKNA